MLKEEKIISATERFCTILSGNIPDRVPLLVFAMEPTHVRYNLPLIMLETPAEINSSCGDTVEMLRCTQFGPISG